MFIRISMVCFSMLFVMLLAAPAVGQIDASMPNGKPSQQREELPKNIKETLAKQRIARDKKDYEELLERSEEAVKLSDELEKSFADANGISTDVTKKLDRLEKLVKKIRGELGGEDEGNQASKQETDKTEKPSSMVSAFETLQSNASQLFDEIKKSTRYSVSVIAIQTANALLKIVKFIRFGQ